MTATHDNRHTCEYSWCNAILGDNEEHVFFGITVEADDLNTYGATNASVGMILNDGELPQVYLHLQGGHNDADVDIYLTAQAAASLELDLRKAVLTAATTTPVVIR